MTLATLESKQEKKYHNSTLIFGFFNHLLGQIDLINCFTNFF
ncbi:hypothetical protein cce_1926 [Crocosphaera subtropica ATCC 51142]|uniref:Uncharacterized protein n=1 Tax=Crocosphaera subtropica (strain ATCC 51142 / BH68) TaxID=43989 RepID=B1X0I7_CROS5|nr:hypothetical protein cce_1926 [Crocosphaera subtropica ATCC 51142]